MYWHGTLSWPAYVTRFTRLTVTSHQSVWWLDAKIHREGDRPAIVRDDGGREWRRYGQLHRDHDRPAKIYPNSGCEWKRQGAYHREHDRPAIIRLMLKIWQQKGAYHRDNDRPAYVSESDGGVIWYQHGRQHRDGDKPAAILGNNDRFWFMHGRMFRDGDRPSIVYSHGGRSWEHYGLGTLTRATNSSYHRDDGPAEILSSGECRWYRDGELQHRCDKHGNRT